MPDPAKKSCTIRELARHVGLSTCTVSRVLNHRSGELPIPEKTQERIREAARALNYVPNVNAQRFFKRRSNVIGLLVPPQEEMGHNAFNDTHFVEILSGIEKALCRTGYNLLLLFNRPEFQENNHYAGLFQSGFLDGLLIWGVHRSDRYWNELAALSGPRIFLTSLPGAEGSASLSFVASDYEHSAFGIVSHLLEKGRRSFCWLAGKEDTSIIPQLEAGIRRAGVRIPPGRGPDSAGGDPLQRLYGSRRRAACRRTAGNRPIRRGRRNRSAAGARRLALHRRPVSCRRGRMLRRPEQHPSCHRPFHHRTDQ